MALQKYREKSPLQLVKEHEIEEEEIELNFEDDNLDLNFLLEMIQQLPDRYRLVFN